MLHTLTLPFLSPRTVWKKVYDCLVGSLARPSSFVEKWLWSAMTYKPVTSKLALRISTLFNLHGHQE